MEMDKVDEQALEASIFDWKLKDQGGTPNRDCPLCDLSKFRDGKSFKCESCIVKRHTGKPECYGTPYYRNNTLADYHQQEIDFLESLRPEKNVDMKRDTEYAIEIGDEVTVFDSSWALQLCRGETKDITVNISEIVYTVIRTRLRLPVGNTKTHPTHINNDTIIYNPNSRNYVLVRERCLKLKTPKYCTECGKENW